MGGGWRESVDDHTATMVGDDKRRERARDDEGNNEDWARAMVTTKRVPGNREGKGGKGHGIGDEGGVQQRGQW